MLSAKSFSAQLPRGETEPKSFSGCVLVKLKVLAALFGGTKSFSRSVCGGTKKFSCCILVKLKVLAPPDESGLKLLAWRQNF
jgi:hypothetical protein